jgi:pyridoxal phosphate enzyme (YggS family)
MYSKLKEELDSQGVALVAVSKTKPQSAILEMYAEGQRAFGENRVQELVEKYEALPKDIEWHMIGHLQSKKVKKIISFVHLIHGVDSLKLLEKINSEAQKVDRVVDVLIQFHIANESTKYGFERADIPAILEKVPNLSHVSIRGVMGMATFTEDTRQVASEFKTLKELFDALVSHKEFGKKFNVVSMGMSGDYKIAIDQGSNMVRIGSLLFGKRT